jgi:GNAT superfamily N-acetyltransferase
MCHVAEAARLAIVECPRPDPGEGGRHTRQVTDRELIRRIERADAAALARLPGILVDQDPSRVSESRPVAGGHLVLCGPGLYVNRALAVGIDAPMHDDDLDVVEQRSAAMGVAPAVEVTDATQPGTLDLLTARGYEHHPDLDVMLLARDLKGDLSESLPVEGVRIVEAPPGLWSKVSASGFEVGGAGRAASDAWAAAVALVDDLMLVATAPDGRPLGSATVRFLGDIAVLGGMSTIPAERGRGVQAALLGYRMQEARERGCSIATTSARVDGPSERNLLRHGFEPLTRKRTFVVRPESGNYR